MSSKRVQTRQVWTEKEREDIRAYHSLHPDHNSNADNIQDVPVISYKNALEGLEALRLFRLQNPHANLQKAEQLEGLLYREKTVVESLQGMARRRQHQTAIRGFFSPQSEISWFLCIYLVIRNLAL